MVYAVAAISLEHSLSARALRRQRRWRVRSERLGKLLYTVLVCLAEAMGLPDVHQLYCFLSMEFDDRQRPNCQPQPPSRR